MNEKIIEIKPHEQEILDKFSDQLRVDEREGYHGLFVDRENLLSIMESLRDEVGYDHLTSVTGVDYLQEELLEVVYHLFKSTGGAILEIKVQTPRSDPVVPSLVGLFPGADFQEREAWDLMGIRFEGHPNLKRILMWEGFEGHPLQKDWKIFAGHCLIATSSCLSIDRATD